MNNYIYVGKIINSFGMNIRGVYGEKSDISGDMYQISNKITLGLSTNVLAIATLCICPPDN